MVDESRPWIMQGKPCTVFGDGEQTRAFSHIADVAPAIADSVDIPEAYNEVFNIGAEKPYSVNELARIVQKHMGADTGVEHLEARNEVVHAFSDHSKATTILGSHPSIDLDDGIGRMVDWVKAVGPRASKEFEGIEIEKNLPPSWRSVVTA